MKKTTTQKRRNAKSAKDVIAMLDSLIAILDLKIAADRSKSKCGAAPWHVSKSGSFILDANERVVFDVFVHPPRSKAIVALAAAAPELLLCAMSFEAYLLSVGKTRDRGLLSDVRAAIAKANGRVP